VTAATLLALACTGDPLLDGLLKQCRTIRLASDTGETPEDALRLAATHGPAILFVGPALGDLTPVYQQAAGATVVCLTEGPTAGDGCHGNPLTADLIDNWVRQRMLGEAAGLQPAPKKPTAGFKVPAISEQTPKQPANPPATGPVLPPAVSHGPVSVLRQRIVALWGGKPGSGRSTLAVGLSDLLSQLGGVKVCTVDLNPYNSSLAVLTGKEQEVPSWVNLAEGLGRGGPNLSEALRWVKPNWAVLTGTDGRPDWLELLQEPTLHWLIAELRNQFDYILLDLDTRRGALTDAALRCAQTVMVVVSPDYPDVLDTHRAIGTAADRHVLDRGRCRLILNRWVETPSLSAGTVSEFLGLPLGARIPAAPEAVIEAATQGMPVTRLTTPGAKAVTQGMTQAMHFVAEAVAGPAPARTGGLLSGLFHR